MSRQRNVHFGETFLSVKRLVGETVSVKCPVGVMVVGEMSPTDSVQMINFNSLFLFNNGNTI